MFTFKDNWGKFSPALKEFQISLNIFTFGLQTEGKTKGGDSLLCTYEYALMTPN